MRHQRQRHTEVVLVKVDSAHVKAVMKITDLFEEHEDVQSVYSNAEFDDADLEAMA